MKWHSIYRLADGIFTGARVRARVTTDLIAPAGCGIVRGDFDPAMQRVDVVALAAAIAAAEPQYPESGDAAPALDVAAFVVDYTPPPDVARVARDKDRRARQNIAAIERRQLRAIREALLILLPDGPEKTRLQQIESRIATLRADLSE